MGRRCPRAEAAVAIQIKCRALKQPPHVTQSIAAPFQDLQLVIQPFHKAAVLVGNEVVRRTTPTRLANECAVISRTRGHRMKTGKTYAKDQRIASGRPIAEAMLRDRPRDRDAPYLAF